MICASWRAKKWGDGRAERSESGAKAEREHSEARPSHPHPTMEAKPHSASYPKGGERSEPRGRGGSEGGG